MNLPHPGETYRFTEDFEFTKDGVPVSSFKEGDLLKVIRATNEDPYGNRREDIPNFWVEGPNGKTVWSRLPILIKIGVLVLTADNKIS